MITDVVDDLRTLVAFPTVSSRPNLALIAWLAERCEALGLRIERFDDPEQDGKATLIARAGPDGDDDGGLVISGHTDVVPTDGQPWHSDPFVLTARDGRLIGRGSADMKGFIAATLVGLAALDLRRLRRPLVLIWTHDEEVGCRGSAKLAAALVARDAALPTSCWIGEPTGMTLLRQHAGHVAIELRCHGSAAHSAYPELGANALVAAARLALAADSADLGAAAKAACGDDRVPLNIASLHGGDVVNIVPDFATLRLGFRQPPGCAHEPLLAALDAALAATQLPLGTTMTREVLRVTPSLRTVRDSALELVLRRHLVASEIDRAGFATDGGNLALLGCQPLIFGPGRIEVAHQADEYVLEAELRAAVNVVSEVVADALFAGAA
jgi:acetylornithine deacetylase